MSQDWFGDVLAFHKKFGCYIGDTPAVPSENVAWLRSALIREEKSELDFAVRDGNLPKIADAIADLVYVLLGMAVAYGIDMRTVWDAVQESNMAKEGGAMRKDGKVCKPKDWQAPDIAGLLAKQKPLLAAREAVPIPEAALPKRGRRKKAA